MKQKILRIGFDFDGVIAYNPLRILRAPMMTVRRWFTYRPDLEFPLPKNPHFKWLWALAHETSFFPSYGFDELKKQLKEGSIEGYIITGRYSFLKNSLENWFKKHHAEKLFSGIYLNEHDEQPHKFKKEMIRKLDLDMYVEDNWDIVQYLKNAFDHEKGRQAQIHWIYNLLDRFKPFPHKYPYLKKFLENIST